MPSDKQFDVALSFAGEDRDFVKAVAAILREQGVSTFYDEDFAVELWGEDLYTYLDEVYRRRAQHVVMFASRHYVNKAWPDHERQSAQARALVEDRPYLLPVRLDDTDVPGLRPTISYLDARRLGLERIAEMVGQKVRGTTAQPAPAWDGLTPRTAAHREQMLRERPGGWEWMLLGTDMLLGMAGLEEKYRDHQLRTPLRKGQHLSRQDALSRLDTLRTDAVNIAESIMGIFSPEAQERAFGAPGEAGDEAYIHHLAARLVGVYEQFMDWAAEQRGLAVPMDLRDAFGIAARFVDAPIDQIREFVQRYVDSVDQVPAHIAKPEPKEPLVIELDLSLSMDEALSEEFADAVDRIQR